MIILHKLQDKLRIEFLYLYLMLFSWELFDHEEGFLQSNKVRKAAWKLSNVTGYATFYQFLSMLILFGKLGSFPWNLLRQSTGSIFGSSLDSASLTTK